ncbi:hypothetical protein Bbelb_380230, partial [Branchiostoma belcheri]
MKFHPAARENVVLSNGVAMDGGVIRSAKKTRSKSVRFSTWLSGWGCGQKPLYVHQSLNGHNKGNIQAHPVCTIGWSDLIAAADLNWRSLVVADLHPATDPEGCACEPCLFFTPNGKFTRTERHIPTRNNPRTFVEAAVSSKDGSEDHRGGFGDDKCGGIFCRARRGRTRGLALPSILNPPPPPTPVDKQTSQNAITLPDDGTTRTNLGDDSILEYGYTTRPGATMLFEVWKKQPSSGIANKVNNGSFNVFAAWRGRAEPVGQASLKLFSVTKNEAGQYQLSMTFSDGTSDSKERTLIVQFAPEDTTVTAAPGLIAKEGDAQVVLTCQSGGIPAPTYTWTGDNLPAHAAQDPNTGTLTITNIQRSAAGQYTCTADNGVPQLPGDNPTALTNSVNVQVQYGPSSATITRDPADKVVQWSTVALSCAVDTANPPAIYTWSRVNGTLPTNTDVDQIAGTLRLRSIQPDAVGTYQCSATNRIGDP